MEDREKLLHALFDAVRAASPPHPADEWAWPWLHVHGAFAVAELRRWADLRGVAVELHKLEGSSGQWDTVSVDLGGSSGITAHLDDHLVAAAGARS